MAFKEPLQRGIVNYKLKRSLVVLCLLFGTAVCLVYTRPPSSIGSSDEVYNIKTESDPIQPTDDKTKGVKSALISAATDRTDFQFYDFKSRNLSSNQFNTHNRHVTLNDPNAVPSPTWKTVPANNAIIPNAIPPNMIAVPSNINPLPKGIHPNLIALPADLNTVPHLQPGQFINFNAAPPNMIAVPRNPEPMSPLSNGNLPNLVPMPSNVGYAIPKHNQMAPNLIAAPPRMNSNFSVLNWTPMPPNQNVQPLIPMFTPATLPQQHYLPPNMTASPKNQDVKPVQQHAQRKWKPLRTTWQTDNIISSTINETTATGKGNSSKPVWTWMCRDARCERRTYPEYPIQMSLATCNMICVNQPLWPHPTGRVELKKSIIPLAETFSLHVHNVTAEKVTKYLEEAFDLLKQELLNLIKPTKLKKYKRKELRVHVSVDGSSDPRLKLNTKENYKLTLNTSRTTVLVDIQAESFCGARLGFATLSQLVWFEPFQGSLVTFGQAYIEDKPKFRYRGLLLDTARQFFPVSDILRTLDAMAISKLNTFHWHATDSQSFPLKLKSAPFLAKFGSYGPKQVYTNADIKKIVHHARVRGIRVVIEVDVPAHVGYAWSWGRNMTYGDLALCVNQEPWREVCGEPPCGQLNPTNERVYDLLRDIYAEIIELTGVDDVFHLGGDEVNLECWNRNVKYKDDKLGMDTWYDFMQRAKYALMLANGGKWPPVTIIWSSKLTSQEYMKQILYNEYTIQVWEDTVYVDPQSVSGMGIRIINSQVTNWYLDCGFGSWIDEAGSSCGKYRTWQDVYNHITWINHHNWNVEGGTVCMWTELVGPSGLDARVWPRAAAVAERLWDDDYHGATDDEYVRLDMHRTRLVERGIKAKPIFARWCSDNPYMCLNYSVIEW